MNVRGTASPGSSSARQAQDIAFRALEGGARRAAGRLDVDGLVAQDHEQPLAARVGELDAVGQVARRRARDRRPAR